MEDGFILKGKGKALHQMGLELNKMNYYRWKGGG